MNIYRALTKLAVYAYIVGLIIYFILIFTPFALAVVWPVGLLPLLIPLAGCWGVIPYPIIGYLGLSHTTGAKGLFAYYIILSISIFAQIFIIVKSLTAMGDRSKSNYIFKVLQIHHIFIGVFMFLFMICYPLIRDIRAGINIFKLEYILLILIGVYGFIINITAALAIKNHNLKIFL